MSRNSSSHFVADLLTVCFCIAKQKLHPKSDGLRVIEECVDASVMPLHIRFCDSKPDTIAACLLRSCSVGAIKAIEQSVRAHMRQRVASVGHFQHDTFSYGSQGDVYAAFGSSVSNRIVRQHIGQTQEGLLTPMDDHV